MKIRFQADADLNHVILLAITRRQLAIDFQTAVSASLAGVVDPEVLARTAKDGRTLVTHDQKTMPRHFAKFIMDETSPGIIVIPQSLPIAAAAEDLILIWSETDAEEWINRMGFLPL